MSLWRWPAVTATSAALCLVAAQQAWRPALASVNPVAPPLRLADTGLYADPPGPRTQGPTHVAPEVRPFVPQYPLWSDGLTKRRWVYLPRDSRIDASDEHAWRFPVGTRLWKEFSLDGRKVETRMLWKASEAGWVPAAYVWNEEGTDAVLAPEDGVPGVVEIAPGKRHSIPALTDCTACHGAKRAAPLGFNALQLSTDRDPNAIHGEPLQAGMLTLRTLIEERLLWSPGTTPIDGAPRIRSASPATRTVLGYLSTNCGMCHNGRGEIAALGPTFVYRELLEDGDAVARRLVGHPTRWQVPGVADGESVLVHATAPELSAVLVRMRSRAPSSQMPPLGTVVRDEAAVDAVTRWIASEAGLAH